MEYGFVTSTIDKLAAKSIILERELTIEELYEGYKSDHAFHYPPDLPFEYFGEAVRTSFDAAFVLYNTTRLIDAGYSPAFSAFIASKGIEEQIEAALVYASMPNLSDDVKAILIVYYGKTNF